jgi:hypothetical protein
VQTRAPQPTARRVASFLWFPFFFAAAFGLIGLYSFHHPTPHDMRIVVAPATDTTKVTAALDSIEPDGFDVEPADSNAAAQHAVDTGQAAAAITSENIYVSSGASPLRANYLTKVLPQALGTDAPVVDVRPTASGDVSGVSVFFYGLPQVLVGLITSIVLLQLGMWPLRRKLVTIAATGAFTAIMTYVLAVSLDVIPSDLRLPLYGFLLTQAIGWLTTAAALNLRQYFMPTAMTFVLVLGIPSSGATVNGDMLPSVVAWLNDLLPFAAFVDAVRATSYASVVGVAQPLLVMSTWALAGAALLTWTSVRARKAAAAARLAERQPSEELKTTGERDLARLHGRITTLSERPVPNAFVSVLDESGEELERTTTNTDGEYEIASLSTGLHHIVVTAHHCEPAIVTVALHPKDDRPRDIALQDWNDPAANLSAAEIGARRRLTSFDPAATGSANTD